MKEGLSKEIVGPRKGFDRVTYFLYQGRSVPFEWIRLMLLIQPVHITHNHTDLKSQNSTISRTTRLFSRTPL